MLPLHYETFEPAGKRKGCGTDSNLYIPQTCWLNMAEIGLHVLNGQCLNRNISTKEEINQEVEAWTMQRNKYKVTSSQIRKDKIEKIVSNSALT